MLFPTLSTIVAFFPIVVVRTSPVVTTKTLTTIYLTDSRSLKNEIKFSDNQSDHLHEAQRSAEKFAGLDIANTLNKARKQAIRELRHVPQFGSSINGSNSFSRDKRKMRWYERHITYSIESYPKQLSRTEVREAIKIAFDTWSNVTPLRFNEVPTNGDIVIKFSNGEHGDTHPFDGKGKVLAHALHPPYGLLHFDGDEHWIIKKPNDFSSLPRNDSTNLLPVAIHEIGHVLGLEHSEEQDSIMAPFYHNTIDAEGNYLPPKLTNSDISLIQGLYGINKKISDVQFLRKSEEKAPNRMINNLSILQQMKMQGDKARSGKI